MENSKEIAMQDINGTDLKSRGRNGKLVERHYSPEKHRSAKALLGGFWVPTKQFPAQQVCGSPTKTAGLRGWMQPAGSKVPSAAEVQRLGG